MAQAGHLCQVRTRNSWHRCQPTLQGRTTPTPGGRPLLPGPGGCAAPAAPRSIAGVPPAPFFPLLHIRSTAGHAAATPGFCPRSTPQYIPAASTRALQPPHEPSEIGYPDPLFLPLDPRRHHPHPGPQTRERREGCRCRPPRRPSRSRDRGAPARPTWIRGSTSSSSSSSCSIPASSSSSKSPAAGGSSAGSSERLRFSAASMRAAGTRTARRASERWRPPRARSERSGHSWHQEPRLTPGCRSPMRIPPAEAERRKWARPPPFCRGRQRSGARSALVQPAPSSALLGLCSCARPG